MSIKTLSTVKKNPDMIQLARQGEEPREKRTGDEARSQELEGKRKEEDRQENKRKGASENKKKVSSGEMTMCKNEVIVEQPRKEEEKMTKKVELVGNEESSGQKPKNGTRAQSGKNVILPS